MLNNSKDHSILFSSILSQSLDDKGQEDYVLKLSNGKCFFNRRYLSLKNGIISYYRDKPAEFATFSSSQQKPKGKVHILDTDIKKVDSAFAKKKNHPFMFQISFFSAGSKKKKF